MLLASIFLAALLAGCAPQPQRQAALVSITPCAEVPPHLRTSIVTVGEASVTIVTCPGG